MKIIALIILLGVIASGESRYDRLAREYEARPTQRTYDRLMREWWRIERRNRSLERKLPPAPTTVNRLDRACDGDYDLRKQLRQPYR